MTPQRHPGGTPAGGRFAAGSHAESDVVLGHDLEADWVHLHEELDAWESDAARIADEQADLEVRGRDLHQRFTDLAGQRIAAGLETARPTGPPASAPPVAAVEQDAVLDSRDPRVAAGEVFDVVRVYDPEFGDTEGTVFHRRRDGVDPDWPYAMRFQADRELTPDEVAHCAQLIGYAYRAEVRGEQIGRPVRDTPFSFTVYADTTKTRSDDIGAALDRFETTLPELMRDGSPIRTTDRSGPGTRGTRLVEGFGASVPRFELYYDSVVVDPNVIASDGGTGAVTDGGPAAAA